MGLLGKIFSKKDGPAPDIVTLSREELQKEIVKLADNLYDVRQQEGYQILHKFVEKSLSQYILDLSDRKELTGEAYAFHRGKIDGVRNLLIAITRANENSKNAKGPQRSSDNPAKRSYISRPRVVGQAGLLD